jgi:hypothetical protein
MTFVPPLKTQLLDLDVKVGFHRNKENNMHYQPARNCPHLYFGKLRSMFMKESISPVFATLILSSFRYLINETSGAGSGGRSNEKGWKPDSQREL